MTIDRSLGQTHLTLYNNASIDASISRMQYLVGTVYQTKKMKSQKTLLALTVVCQAVPTKLWIVPTKIAFSNKSKPNQEGNCPF